jgi:hypothetical protein
MVDYRLFVLCFMFASFALYSLSLPRSRRMIAICDIVMHVCSCVRVWPVKKSCPPSPPKGEYRPRPYPQGEISDLFKAIMLDLGGCSVMGDQSRGKEGKLFGYSVLDTTTLRNGLVLDPERLPDIMNKHFTEQMAEFVACPWPEGQGGDLDVEHSDLLTDALTALVGKQHDEAVGGNTMDTQWKQVNRITLSSIKTLEDLTTRLEDLRDSETTLSQTMGTNLEAVMLKAGYDEYLTREWVPMSHLYIISLLDFQYYVGLHTHLWKIATNYRWQHAELQMEHQHGKEMNQMRQIRQSHGTHLQVACLTYIYLLDQRDKSFHSYKIEDKMNEELRLELDTQGNLLETTRAEIETFKGGTATTGGGHSFKMVCFHYGMPGPHKGGQKFCQWKNLSQAEARGKGLKFVTNALQGTT